MAEIAVKKSSRMLFVELDAFEKKEQNARMIKGLKEKAKLEAAKKAAADRFKSDITFQEGIIDEALKLVDEGRLEEVDTEERHDYDHNTVTTIRMDTGEQIEERPMTKDERQLELL